MSLLPEVKSTYQHYVPADYRPVAKAKPSIAEALQGATFGDASATFTEKHLPGYNHRDTFGVLAANGPDAFTLSVVTGSGRVLATADLQAGNDLFDSWKPGAAR